MPYGDNASYQRQAIQAAKDLGYGMKVVWKLENAKTDAEVERIMRDARKEKFDAEN